MTHHTSLSVEIYH